jgi:hypothetical protein
MIKVRKDIHLKLGKQWKITVFYMFSIKKWFAFLILKLCIEMTLENFAGKTCYDYF